MRHILDRPVWQALATRHPRLGEGGPLAKRYATDISPFAAARDDDAASLRALGALVPAGGMAVLLQSEACPPIEGTKVTFSAPGVQMVARNVEPLASHPDIIALGDADAPDMVELATLTKPGPFLARSHLFGGYIGVRRQGKLIAMAGKRLSFPGYTEVSGVCTHPEARGQGLAGILSRIVAARILARGETPFLHAWAANEPAIRLYKALGFAHRRDVVVTGLTRA